MAKSRKAGNNYLPEGAEKNREILKAEKNTSLRSEAVKRPVCVQRTGRPA